MQKLVTQKDFLLGLGAIICLLGVFFGLGYFWGRYEQIQRNKLFLKPIPDVNCGVRAEKSEPEY